MARAPKTSVENDSLALIHGDDEFAVKQRARTLYADWSAELGGMDHEVVDAQANNSGDALKALGRLREALQTLPFFGTGKAIWFANCNFLGEERAAQSASVTESLASLAEELKAFPWEKVKLVISAGKVDKRKVLYKTLEKIGRVEPYTAWSLEDKNWTFEAETLVTRELKERGKRIHDSALEAMVAAVGPHRRQLVSETEKLSLYVGERDEATLEDVQAVVTRNKQGRAFALGDALGTRDLPQVLRTLDEALWEVKLDTQKSEIGILYGLIAKVRAMIFLREMLREGWIRAESDYNSFKAQLERAPSGQLPEDKRFNPLEMNPYMLYKALPHARKYSTAELVRAMELLLDCNQRLVTSGADETLVLQQTLMQIVRGQAQ